MLPERLRLARQYLDDAQYLLFGLRRLYELRLDVDDDAVPIARASAETGVQTVQRRLGEID